MKHKRRRVAQTTVNKLDMAHNQPPQGWRPHPSYPPQPQTAPPSYYPQPPPYAYPPPAQSPAPAPAPGAAPQHAYRGALANAQPPAPQQQHALPQYNAMPAYGMQYGMPPNIFYPGAQPYGAPQDYGGGGAGAGVAGGGVGQRCSPTSSINSTLRRIDDAIQYGSAAPPPHVRGGAISMGSFDAAIPPMPAMPYAAPPPPQVREADADVARKAFNEANKDKSGYITFREFLQSLADLGLKIPYHDALDKFSKLDVDKDGRVVETEFVNGYLHDKLGALRAPR